MPDEDGLETRGIQRAGFDELEEPGLVLGPSGLERDGREVFGGEDAGWRAIDIGFHGLREGLLPQRSGGREELDRPATDDDVFPLHRSTTCLEVIKNGLGADNQAPLLRLESDEDIHVQRGDGLEVEGRSDRAPDCVTFNHAISLHLVDRFDDFPNVHISPSLAYFISCREGGVQFFEQFGQLCAKQLMRLAQSAALIER